MLALDLGTPSEAVRAALGALGSVGDDRRGRRAAAGSWRAARRPVGRRRRGGAAVRATARSISWSRRWRCNSSTICPGTLVQIRRALKPDGLFLAALLGGDTLTELRQSFAAAESEVEGGVSPRVAPFADLRDLGALLQRAGFALPVTDVDRLIVRYDSVFALMHDLRRMGATNPLVDRRRTPLRRATLMRMAEIYARALRRCRRPHARDLRDRLAVGLGAASGPAAAAAARLGAKRGSPTRSARGRCRQEKRRTVN